MKKYLLLFLIVFVHSNCQVSNFEIKNSFSNHDISVMLLPDNNIILAKDTLQIEYLDQTNDLYFYLNASLSIKKVRIGNQDIDFTNLNSQQLPNFNNCFNLYQIDLPKSLFPQSIDIWYEGVYSELLELSGNSIIQDTKQKSLDGTSCWYPRTFDDKSTFTVKTLTSEEYQIQCDANLVQSENLNNCLLCCWEQSVPVDHFDFYVPGNQSIYN